MEKTRMVFAPPPSTGHIFPCVQLAKLLTSMNQHLYVTLLLMKLPLDQSAAKYINSLPSISTPRLKFVEIDLPEESYSHLLSRKTFFFDYVEAHKSKVSAFLNETASDFSSSVVVVDMFTTAFIDVANELGYDSYMFYTSGAAMLGLKLHLQSLSDEFNVDVSEYKNLDIELGVTTYMKPISSKLLPSVFYDKGISRVFFDCIKRFREVKGIIVNTFLELELYALQALSEDKNIPKVYTAGPSLNLDSRVDNNEEATTLLKWLDRQPESSVVFLCFGSQGRFGVEQIKEIAIALEQGEYRFIWSLRKHVLAAESNLDNQEDYNNDLPQGFLQRRAGIGHVIGWAPQMAVLSHPAVGGFVSHCGWNSILESIWCGVPIAAWPMYAEQNANALQIVKDIGIAVEVKMDYRNEPDDDEMKNAEIVSADLIKDSINRLMDPKNDVRKKVKKLKEESRLVLKEGGSSYASLTSFLYEIGN